MSYVKSFAQYLAHNNCSSKSRCWCGCGCSSHYQAASVVASLQDGMQRSVAFGICAFCSPLPQSPPHWPGWQVWPVDIVEVAEGALEGWITKDIALSSLLPPISCSGWSQPLCWEDTQEVLWIGPQGEGLSFLPTWNEPSWQQNLQSQSSPQMTVPGPISDRLLWEILSWNHPATPKFLIYRNCQR